MDGIVTDLRSAGGLSDKDVEALLAVLVGGSRRIERIALSRRVLWIKRYGTERPSWWMHLQSGLSRLIPLDYLRPSPYLTPKAMAEREARSSAAFAKAGFAVPAVLYASSGAIVLSDVGPTVQSRLNTLAETDPAAHDDLMVRCAAELGRLHAAGLCHGRPYPRDMFFSGERIGFMDFEEEPQSVMPMATAQARDIWLLFLRIGTAARNGAATRERAYRAWSSQAPEAAVDELRRMTGFLVGFLWLARLIGRVHMGSDLRRFIIATSYLAAMFIDYTPD